MKLPHKLPQQPWMRWPATERLVRAFGSNEFRYVGGAVRDALLGRMVVDVDIATLLRPEAVMDLLAASGIKAVPTGITHGTVTAVINKTHFEITTLRKDTACDGRHAEIEYTDNWEVDAKRRDFTINALYAGADGTLYDYVDGLLDIAEKRLRFIGDARLRIEEDALRILRYFRFMAQLNMVAPLDIASYVACEKEHARIDALSGERIRQEMLKLLAVPGLSTAVCKLMRESGAWARVFGQDAPFDWAPLQAVETKEGLSADPLLRAAWLLRLAGARSVEMLSFIQSRWRVSGAEYTRLSLLAVPPVAVQGMDERAQQRAIRRVGGALFHDLVVLAWAAELLEDKEEPPQLVRRFRPMLKLAREWSPPVFPVKGEDLLARGMQSGPEVGKILARLEEVWEASGYKFSKEELLKQV